MTFKKSPLSETQRFWAKVAKTEGCWLWLAGKSSAGYGNVKMDGRWQGAHRVAYTLLRGPIPEGLQLDHLCRNRACVNPAHLDPCTAKENAMRSELTLQSRNKRKTHCPKGHPYGGDNLVVVRGERYCRECRNQSTRKWRSRQIALRSDGDHGLPTTV
jgi:hypothetical protein